MKILFCTSLLLFQVVSYGQIKQEDKKGLPKPAKSGESIELFTDRSLYCTNEQVYFSAVYSCTEEMNSITWSNVLYVELIKWNGNPLIQLKVELNKKGASGSFKIPGNILSGNYYLRAYTKWMRNYPANLYEYALVKVINPFKPDIDTGPEGQADQQDSLLLSGMRPMKRINGIAVTTDKRYYKPGEKAEIELFTDNSKYITCDRYSISVVKNGTLDTSSFSINAGLIPQNNPDKHLSEISEISVSGKIIDKTTGIPLDSITIHLSEPSSGKYFTAFQTDEDGRFVFTLPDKQGEYNINLFSGNNKSTPSEKYLLSFVETIIPDSVYFLSGTTNNYKSGNIEYFPEIRGISLSGKIIDKTTGIPLKNVTMYLSEPSTGKYFSTFMTDDNGRFIFTFPYMQGKYDFYIGADLDDTLKTEILIDNDFCNQPVALPYIPFRLSDDEKKLVREMMINSQLTEKFLQQPYTMYDENSITGKQSVFYGHAKSIIYPEKYIELPNLKEFFIEIIPNVYVTHKRKNSSLRNAEETGLSKSLPLILLDNIPVHNIQNLLKIPSSVIEKIDVIDKGYIIANMRYNGLICIYSKNNDFAGAEMNKNSMFFSYKLYSEDIGGSDIGKERTSDTRIPDRRNLLFWDPAILLSAGEKKRISFSTSDNKGDYIISVRGYSNSDKTEIYGTCYFTVQ